MGADVAEGVEVVRGVEEVRWEEAAGRPTHEDGLQARDRCAILASTRLRSGGRLRPRLCGRLRPTGQGDDVPERRPERDLGDARAAGAANRDEDLPGTRLRPDPSERLFAVDENPRDRGKGLDV